MIETISAASQPSEANFPEEDHVTRLSLRVSSEARVSQCSGEVAEMQRGSSGCGGGLLAYSLLGAAGLASLGEADFGEYI